jgi:hypothetical protein
MSIPANDNDEVFVSLAEIYERHARIVDRLKAAKLPIGEHHLPCPCGGTLTALVRDRRQTFSGWEAPCIQYECSAECIDWGECRR